MKFGVLFIFFILFIGEKSVAQLRLGLEETYLPGTKWRKVMVCIDDLTVLALSADGRVYYKKNTDASFQAYGPTIGLNIEEIAGYSYNELYFLIKPNLIYYVKDGNTSYIEMAGQGVTQINNIAVVNASKNDRLEGYYGKRDWLAVATNNNLYPIFRGDAVVSAPYVPPSEGGPLVNPDWRITNGGFKSVEFQYKNHLQDDCFGNVSHAYFYKIGENDKTTILPEITPYSEKINCTYFGAPYNEGKGINETNYADFWGTDNGVYAKGSTACDLGSIRIGLAGEVINDLEELNFLRSISNQRWLLAAGNKGLHFSTVPVSSLGLWDFTDSFNFYDFPPLNNIKVNHIASEITNLAEICEKVVWLATDEGIKELSVNMSYPLYGGQHLLSFSEIGEPGRFDMCPGREITMTANLPDNYAGNYFTQWFKDDVELMGLRGKTVVTFKEPAVYTYKLISVCNNIGTEQDIWLRRVDEPVITFKPTADINICEGGTATFTTKSVLDHKYKWVKDDVDIPGATENTYTASTAGTYKVLVSNCQDGYQSSDAVKLNVIALTKPQIIRSSTKSLCFGETVNLSVPVINGATYRWSSGETTAAIEAKGSGNFTVEIKLGTCSSISDPVSVVVSKEILLDKPADAVVCEFRQEQVRLTAAGGFAFYTWNGKRGTANFMEVTEPGVYILEVEDLNGCKAMVSYTVLSRCEVLPPPNAFSPNGDGINDLWVVDGLENDPIARIMIYNRYGILVYQTSGESAVWDGKSKNRELSAGVYYYLIFSKNVNKPLKGSVAIIR